jgi:hypothetical protein
MASGTGGAHFDTLQDRAVAQPDAAPDRGRMVGFARYRALPVGPGTAV